jgi:TolB-like protein/DNA-binding winged helix-turn-helix (wHTH) protein
MNYCFGDCELNTGLYTLQRAGQTNRLRPKVFRVCLYLLEHRDRVVSREELCTQVWSGQFISQTTLEGVIRAVRQAVGDSGQTQGIIQTLHGYGYRFVADVEECPATTAARGGLPGASGMKAQEASTLSQTAGITVPVASAPMLESAAHPGWAGDSSRGKAVVDDYTAASHGYIAAEEPRATSSPSSRWFTQAHLMMILAVLMVSLLGGWVLWHRVTKGEVVPLDKSRIAVLPFLNLSAEADRAYFADGMTEVMIAQLSQIRGLTVIARTSVMKYKDTRKDVATIGRELGVGTLLEGSVRTIDNQMRINVQLIDVATQAHLWSQEYDRELTEVFGVQSDIATRVAHQLTVQLIAGGNQRIEKQDTGHLDALTLNLQEP